MIDYIGLCITKIGSNMLLGEFMEQASCDHIVWLLTMADLTQETALGIGMAAEINPQ